MDCPVCVDGVDVFTGMPCRHCTPTKEPIMSSHPDNDQSDGPETTTTPVEHALQDATQACTAVIQALARAAAAIVGEHPEDADDLEIRARAARACGDAADMWTGQANGLMDARQRLLLGADRTITVKGDGE